MIEGLGTRLGWTGNETSTDLTSEGPSTWFLFIVQPHPTVAVGIVTCVCVCVWVGVRVWVGVHVWVGVRVWEGGE